MWSDGDSLPHRGWYNGSAKKMIANGTYEDFRPRLLLSVEKGKFARVGSPQERIERSKEQLKKWDEEWSALSIEERLKRRNLVADNAELKETIVNTVRGPQRFLRATPDEGDNLGPAIRKKKKPDQRALPRGSITRDNAPPSLKAIQELVPA